MSTGTTADGWSICPDAIEVGSFFDAAGTAQPIPPPPSAVHLASLHDRFGRYWVAYPVAAPGIVVLRSDGPRPPFIDTGTLATSDAADDNPSLVETLEGQVRLWFARSGTVYYTLSGDDKETWDTPMSILTGTLPASARDIHGTEVVAVVSSNKLYGMRKRGGDRWFNDNHTGSTSGTSSDAAWTLKDDMGADLDVSSDSVALSAALDGTVELAVRLNGDTDISFFYSGDDIHTFTQVL